jgi:hypothetical protein
MKMKLTKKVLSFILVFTFLMQILPVSALDRSDPFDSADWEEREALADAADTEQDTITPPAFVYDEAYSEAEPERPSHIFTDYYSLENDADYYTLQSDTKEIDTNTSKLHDICVNNEYYSELSQEDAAYILDNVKIDSSDLKELESLGLTLFDSVILASLVENKDVTIKDICKACSDHNDLYDLIINLLEFFGYSANNIPDSKTNKELQEYLLRGYSFGQVKNGYEISAILGINVGSLLDKDDAAEKAGNIDESEAKNFKYLANKYNVNVNVLIDYASETALFQRADNACRRWITQQS